MIKLKKTITEVPHMHYGKSTVKHYSKVFVDFRVEKYKISKEWKSEIMKAFFNNKKVAAFLKSKNKWIIFDNYREEAYFKSSVPEDVVKLPDDWYRYVFHSETEI